MNNTNTNTNTNTNNSDNNDDNNNGHIYISTLINNLENLGGEKEKEEFIKSYAKLKEQIEITDNILGSSGSSESSESSDNSDANSNVNPNSQSIQELFNILESNSQFILNTKKLETSKLKTLLKITKILEEKLNTETINIIESK